MVSLVMILPIHYLGMYLVWIRLRLRTVLFALPHCPYPFRLCMYATVTELLTQTASSQSSVYSVPNSGINRLSKLTALSS